MQNLIDNLTGEKTNLEQELKDKQNEIERLKKLLENNNCLILNLPIV